MFASSNMHKLRDFVKHVYVDRKYTGERSHERLPKLRLVKLQLINSPFDFTLFFLEMFPISICI